MNLLPKHHEEFRSKEYWDRFFEERGNAAFEWYGSFEDVASNCIRHIRASDQILVIGCGNSAFSQEFYDKGYHHITNIDFSDQVITSMKEQNISRVDMKWEVMDMTSTTFTNESYQIIFDKGALDALMSENNDEVKNKAKSMFDEISRLLSPGGKYICITLGEEFILHNVIDYFHNKGWYIHTEIVTNTTSSKQQHQQSPFKPLYIVFNKPDPTSSSKNKSTLLLSKRSEVEIANEPFSVMFDNFGVQLRRANWLNQVHYYDLVLQLQQFSQKRYDLGVLKDNRFDTIELFSDDNTSIPRFTLLILDMPRSHGTIRSCAVFFVPFGRESEYQFTSKAGLEGIAQQAQTRRLIVVRCNRPHIFPDMTALQAELSPVALSLAPIDKPEDELIPYMAVQEDSQWESIEEGTIQHAGTYVVEERPVEGSDRAFHRRLIFLQNQHFVQTEMRMILPSTSKNKKTKSKSKSKSNKGKELDKSNETPEMLMDMSYLDDHHRSILVGLALAGSHLKVDSSSKSKSARSIDMAGIISSSCVQARNGEDASNPFILLIGLGGGSLAMAIQKYLPQAHLDVVDIVPELEDIARRNFGFVKKRNCSVIVDDGIAYMRNCSINVKSGTNSDSTSGDAITNANTVNSNGQYDAIVIDVDCKDISRGFSAPPIEFLTDDSLIVMKDLLTMSGILLINIVARDSSLLHPVVQRLQAAFRVGDTSEMYRITPADSHDINTVYCILKSKSSVQLLDSLPSLSNSSLQHTNKKTTKKGGCTIDNLNIVIGKKLGRIVEDWMQVVASGSDPLGLVELAESSIFKV